MMVITIEGKETELLFTVLGFRFVFFFGGGVGFLMVSPLSAALLPARTLALHRRSPVRGQNILRLLSCMLIP